MENFQKSFPIVFFFAFIHFLHDGTEIVLITIIYEMSTFAVCNLDIPTPTALMANMPGFEKFATGMMKKGFVSFPFPLPFRGRQGPSFGVASYT